MLLFEGHKHSSVQEERLEGETRGADFRGTIQKLTLRIPYHTPLPEKLAIVQAIVQEFENYRKRAGDTAVAGANLGSGI